ncbi:MAG: aspartate-semialdehyde dehydrogenase [Candidatus Schekmanbacteria bacterium]|nr:aspartate-semialdehyde dehydrogenase [Candidatus Schekmanbacteria bacterium]
MLTAYHVAVVGATGAVGMEMINVLSQRNFPVESLTLLASERSAGKRLEYNGKHIAVQKLTADSFKGIEIALFSAGASVSKEFAPIAAKAGTVVVDNSSAFRMEPDVPLVVPEVNPQDIFKHKGIIANPNCSTIQMVVALKPLHDIFKIKRIVVSTYQAVSGTGKKAMDELAEQTTKMFSFKPEEIKPRVYPHRIAFNCLPQIDVFLDNGYTKEEMKMVNETRKIMGDDSINVCPTTVRVPVFVGHAEAVNIETQKPITPEEARRILAAAPGVKVEDDPSQSVYPMQINVAGTDDVFVGRIRQDISIPNGLNMWIVADNLRKGAALNAVQIAERLIAGR